MQYAGGGGSSGSGSGSNNTTTQTSTYSLKNFHGDTALILDDQAVATSSLLAYGPFGEPLTPGTLGASTAADTNATDANLGWAADPHRKVQSEFSLPIIQMGARLFVPSLGRFLQVDPVEGGTLNPYVYARDPVNGSDYSGRLAIPFILTGVYFVIAGGVLLNDNSDVSGGSGDILGPWRYSDDYSQDWLKFGSRGKGRSDAKPATRVRPGDNVRRSGYRPTTKGSIPAVRLDTITSAAEARGLAILQSSLHAGIKPTNGFGRIAGLGGGNMIRSDLRDRPGSQKYYFDYVDPILKTKIQYHYSIDESAREYYDVKVKY